MFDKFSCEHNYNCIVPQNMTNEEAKEKGLPIGCKECDFYTMEIKGTKEKIKYKEWDHDR